MKSNNYKNFENLIDKTLIKMEGSFKKPLDNLKEAINKVNVLEQKFDNISQQQNTYNINPGKSNNCLFINYKTEKDMLELKLKSNNK